MKYLVTVAEGVSDVPNHTRYPMQRPHDFTVAADDEYTAGNIARQLYKEWYPTVFGQWPSEPRNWASVRRISVL